MALIKCKECGSEVSDKAKTCPKCGISHPAPLLATKKQWTLWTIIQWVFWGYVFFFFIQVIFNNNSSSSSYSSSSSSNSSASGMTQAACEIQRTEFYANCGDGISNPIKCSDSLKCWKQGNHWRMSKNGRAFL